MIDASWRLAYKIAYRMMRVYWAVRRPDTHGALVAIWHEGRILLVQNSYVPYRSLPGGYVKAGESAKQAALRELKEEVGLVGIREQDLLSAVDIVHQWEGKTDHVEIFRLDVQVPPDVQVDHREVVDARFFTPEEAIAQKLFPPIARHIRERLTTDLAGSAAAAHGVGEQ